jgi:hypothetical protein
MFAKNLNSDHFWLFGNLFLPWKKSIFTKLTLFFVQSMVIQNGNYTQF